MKQGTRGLRRSGARTACLDVSLAIAVADAHNGLDGSRSPWKIWQGIFFWLSVKDTFRPCSFRIVSLRESVAAFGPEIPVSPRMKGQRGKVSDRQVANEC